MKKKILVLMLASMLAASCVACGSKSSDKKDELSSAATEMLSETETETEQIEEQDITADALTPLADAGVITGVEDIIVPEGTDVNLNELVYADKNIVKSVDIDDSAVDYSKAGTYEVIYTITFDGEKLRDYVKENNLNVNFDTNDKTIVVKTKITITVATEEDTEKAIASGDTNVVTPETEKSVAESNKAKANDNAVASKPTEKPAKKPAGNTGNSNAGKHENSNNSGNNSGNNNANAGNNGNGNSGNNGNHNGNSNGNNGNHNGNHNGNNGGNNGNHNGNNKPSEQHTHKYVEISRTDPTCTTDGVITKKCSCGDVITEPNGKALGHNMVHHDAVTHTEQKLVKDAYDEPIYKNGYQCNVCGKFFENDDDALDHVLFDCTKGATYSTAHNVIAGYTHHDAVYETVTITDVEAYNECSRCGAR